VGNVVGDKVVAQRIAFIDRAPELAGLRIDFQPYWVTNARRVDMEIGSVGISLENVSAVLLSWMRIRVIHVGSRTD